MDFSLTDDQRQALRELVDGLPKEPAATSPEALAGDTSDPAFVPEPLAPEVAGQAGGVARPVGRLVGWRLVGQRDDPIDGLCRQRRNTRGPGLVAATL